MIHLGSYLRAVIDFVELSPSSPPASIERGDIGSEKYFVRYPDFGARDRFATSSRRDISRPSRAFIGGKCRRARNWMILRVAVVDTSAH